jgi:hypothetical protein
VSIRLKNLLPFGDWELWFCSALTLLPGMVPTQEARFPAVENALASEPISAITCCAFGAHEN